MSCIANTVVLLIAANGGPVIIQNLLGQRLSCPIDMGLMLGDGQPLFGHTKTWRGLIAGVVITLIIAPAFGLSLFSGAQFGLLAMTGDLLASFLKRRLGHAESSRTRSIDVIPEALLPTWTLRTQLGLGWIDVACAVGLFFLLEMLLSPILYRMHIRKRPY